MRRKKKPGERYSFRRAMGFGTQTVQTVLYGRPVLHVACGGALEIENCRSILLVVDTYQKTLITVRGQVFSIHFGYGGVQGG